MKDREIDEILKQAAQGPKGVDEALLARIAKSVESSLRPVRPLPPAGLLAAGLFSICMAIAVAGAARAGFHGFEKLSVFERAMIFPALGIFMWLAATSWVSEVIPGSGRRVAPGILLGVGSIALLAVFALLFRDYRTEHFVAAGIVCLLVGLLHAIPTALVSWLVLRRGFAVDSVAAGMAAGTLAGLAGVAMLELHCANLEALHVMVWHTAVVVTSGAVGGLVGWVVRGRGRVRAGV